jgi:Zn-dependent protease
MGSEFAVLHRGPKSRKRDQVRAKPASSKQMTVMDVVASLASYRVGFAAAYILLAVFALAIHEAGHILSAVALGIRVKRIGITWRGPFIVREQGSPVASAVVSLAGPVLNVILALAYWEAAPVFARINMVLGLWNLLPFRGSDGSHAWVSLNHAKPAQMSQ